MALVIDFFFQTKISSYFYSSFKRKSFWVFIKCIEYSLFLDFGCGGFACTGKYREIDVEGGAFQRNAHVSHCAAQRLWERRGFDQLSTIVTILEDCPMFENLFELCQIYAGGTIDRVDMSEVQETKFDAEMAAMTCVPWGTLESAGDQSG
ncbi:hypothetical protein ES288_A12G124600v1 [Gossypium darwinii]|nr:hypothetical protein ES288_A12G124600v1 [Gossypium darwinii]